MPMLRFSQGDRPILICSQFFEPRLTPTDMSDHRSNSIDSHSISKKHPSRQRQCAYCHPETDDSSLGEIDRRQLARKLWHGVIPRQRWLAVVPAQTPASRHPEDPKFRQSKKFDRHAMPKLLAASKN